ncbi:MAG: universal stress protein, partial [Bacteroidia bacterium]|nr:universal stress protein [Bacteroidia bacterium]
MSKIGHVIIPIDFSNQSTIALRQSYNLAKFSDAEIVLLHVINQDLFERLKQFSIGKENYEHLLEVGITDSLKEIAKEAISKGLKVSTKVMHGKIYDKISECAGEYDDSIIIMGTRGKINFKKRFIGTNTLRVIKISPCPVITIHGEEHRDGCKNIILPLDIDKETKDKVSRAIDLAIAFDSKITLLTVLDTKDEFIVNKLTRQLHSVKEIVEKHKVECESVMIEG